MSKEEFSQRAYEVWISEIMLQQVCFDKSEFIKKTQVVTVIAYFERWIATWPTIHSLSRATLEEVNAAWSGLGYYSRAKRILDAAQMVCNDLDGNLPTTAG